MTEQQDRDELVELMSRYATMPDTRLTVTHQENAELLAATTAAVEN